MASKVTTCKKTCIECGFSKDSPRGTLQPELLQYIFEQKLFPCHLELKKITGSENTGVEKYIEEVDEIKICRGLIECMYISGIQANSDSIQKLYDEVKNDISPMTMNLGEVVKHHSVYWR